MKALQCALRAVCSTVLYNLHHCIWLHTVISVDTLPGTVLAFSHCLCQEYAALKSQTHGSLKCLKLKYLPNCICYIMSCVNNCKPTVWTHLPLAGLQTTTFLPNFWEKPGWKKMDIMELLYHMHKGGHCVFVWTGIANAMCMCIKYAYQTVLQDLCEVNGSVVRNGPVSQRVQDTQHGIGQDFLEDLEVLLLTVGGRNIHCSGSLGW